MLYLEIALGLVLLFLGGEFLVRGSVGLARAFGVSPLLIGLTLVGFGTSTPELLTSIEAALAGSPGIAVGNIVGSNIANVLLILGLAALMSPIVTQPRAFRRDGPVLIGASLLMVGICLWGELGRLAGALLMALLVAYTLGSFLMERRQQADAAAVMRSDEAKSLKPAGGRPLIQLAIAIAGLVGVLFGARLLVQGALVLAREGGVSETVIGLTLVAVGTSLPELATSVVAAIRRQGDVALGNIVGSNIFNILGIAGATALVQPLSVPAEIAVLDIWVMLAAALALIAFALTGARITRREGGLLLAGYGLYLAVTLGALSF